MTERTKRPLVRVQTLTYSLYKRQRAQGEFSFEGAVCRSPRHCGNTKQLFFIWCIWIKILKMLLLPLIRIFILLLIICYFTMTFAFFFVTGWMEQLYQRQISRFPLSALYFTLGCSKLIPESIWANIHCVPAFFLLMFYTHHMTFNSGKSAFGPPRNTLCKQSLDSWAYCGKSYNGIRFSLPALCKM